MGSKFGRATNPYKPPAVCHKPPIGPDWDVPPFDHTEFEGFCEAFNGNSPSEGGMTASIAMGTTNPTADWFGSAAAGDYRVDLYMDNAAAQGYFNFRLEFFFNLTLDTIWYVANHKARRLIPFDSGLIVPTPYTAQLHASFQLWL